MTAQCPICRSPVDVDDSKLSPEGIKAQCPLCDEVFVVRSAPAPGSTPQAPPVSSRTSAGTPSAGAASASRKLLDEDVEGANPRVLVAHDSHAFGDVVRGLLEEEGFEVEVVHDGDAAHKTILDNPPLIAILEAGLPKKFGFQLCAEMRGMPEPPPVKFLLVASIYDRKRFAKQPELVAAPDDYVEPRNLEIELLPKVRRLLRGRNDSTASRPAVPAGTAARRDPTSVGAPSAPAPAPAAAPVSREPDPVSTSRPSVDADDFKDLFEESDVAPAPPIPSPVATASVRDVDDILRTGSGPAVQASPAANGSDDEDDLLRGVLEDTEPPTVPDPGESAAEGASSSGDRASDGSDDDELLRTLMQMASSEGVEPSKPRLEDDEVLPEGSDEAPSRRVEPDEDSLLGGILEDESSGAAIIERSESSAKAQAVPRELPRDEPTGRAPKDGPMELPSIGSVPEVWKADAEDAKLAAQSDPDELAKLLRGDSASIEMAPPAARAEETSPPKKPALAPETSGDDVIRVSEFELGGPPAKAAEPPPVEPHSNRGGSGSAGFELDGGDDFKAALESDGGLGASSDGAPAGVMPSSGSAGTPTVLKGPAGGGTRAPTKVSGSVDLAEMSVSAEGAMPSSSSIDAGNSFSNTESIGGTLDDDEKSLAEAKVPREMDEELDRLLGGGARPAAESVAAKADAPPARPAPVAAPTGIAAEHEKAKRLAKLIVGDILLYNADRIADAVKSGTFFEVMKGDIKDGRDFYDEKVPEDVRRERDYIQEVLEEVLETKRKELGLA